MTARPAPYAAVAGLLEELPTLLRRTRKARGLDLRIAARQIGCSRATVGRIEAGDGTGVAMAVLVLRWLDGGASVNRTDTEEPAC